MAKGTRERKTVSLALQGGGSHGALTWGVLDALLEDGSLAIDGISGTSAGAMNAVAVAHGFAQAAAKHSDAQSVREEGAALARQALTQFWEGIGLASAPAWSRAFTIPGMAWMTPWLAPAQANPFQFNPLRRVLQREIDFDLLRKSHTGVPKVFVCATNVRTGRGEIFSGPQLGLDAVLASACLPMMFHPVEIDGEAYWDGGYSGNPALHPLIYQARSCDILLVQINPIEHLDVPATVPEIMNRMDEINFNASLLAELRAIEFVRRLVDEGKLDPQKYRGIRMHRVDGGSALAEFGAASKGRADPAFLRQLFDKGRELGLQWLQAHHADLEVRSTLQLTRAA